MTQDQKRTPDIFDVLRVLSPPEQVALVDSLLASGDLPAFRLAGRAFRIFADGGVRALRLCLGPTHRRLLAGHHPPPLLPRATTLDIAAPSSPYECADTRATTLTLAVRALSPPVRAIITHLYIRGRFSGLLLALSAVLSSLPSLRSVALRNERWPADPPLSDALPLQHLYDTLATLPYLEVLEAPGPLGLERLALSEAVCGRLLSLTVDLSGEVSLPAATLVCAASLSQLRELRLCGGPEWDWRLGPLLNNLPPRLKTLEVPTYTLRLAGGSGSSGGGVIEAVEVRRCGTDSLTAATWPRELLQCAAMGRRLSRLVLQVLVVAAPPPAAPLGQPPPPLPRASAWLRDLLHRSEAVEVREAWLARGATVGALCAALRMFGGVWPDRVTLAGDSLDNDRVPYPMCLEVEGDGHEDPFCSLAMPLPCEPLLGGDGGGSGRSTGGGSSGSSSSISDVGNGVAATAPRHQRRGKFDAARGLHLVAATADSDAEGGEEANGEAAALLRDAIARFVAAVAAWPRVAAAVVGPAEAVPQQPPQPQPHQPPQEQLQAQPHQPPQQQPLVLLISGPKVANLVSAPVPERFNGEPPDGELHNWLAALATETYVRHGDVHRGCEYTYMPLRQDGAVLVIAPHKPPALSELFRAVAAASPSVRVAPVPPELYGRGRGEAVHGVSLIGGIMKPVIREMWREVCSEAIAAGAGGSSSSRSSGAANCNGNCSSGASSGSSSISGGGSGGGVGASSGLLLAGLARILRLRAAMQSLLDSMEWLGDPEGYMRRRHGQDEEADFGFGH